MIAYIIRCIITETVHQSLPFIVEKKKHMLAVWPGYVCRSEGHKDKETAILNQFIVRLEAGLNKLKEQVMKDLSRMSGN